MAGVRVVGGIGTVCAVMGGTVDTFCLFGVVGAVEVVCDNKTHLIFPLLAAVH